MTVSIQLPSWEVRSRHGAYARFTSGSTAISSPSSPALLNGIHHHLKLGQVYLAAFSDVTLYNDAISIPPTLCYYYVQSKSVKQETLNEPLTHSLIHLYKNYWAPTTCQEINCALRLQWRASSTLCLLSGVQSWEDRRWLQESSSGGKQKSTEGVCQVT